MRLLVRETDLERRELHVVNGMLVVRTRWRVLGGHVNSGYMYIQLLPNWLHRRLYKPTSV